MKEKKKIKFNRKRLLCGFVAVVLALCFFSFVAFASPSVYLKVGNSYSDFNRLDLIFGNSSGVYSTGRVRGGKFRTFDYYYAGGQNEMRAYVTDKYDSGYLGDGIVGPIIPWENQLISLELVGRVQPYADNSPYIGKYTYPICDELSFNFSAYGSQIYFSTADVYGNPVASVIETQDYIGYRFVGMEVTVNYAMYDLDEDVEGSHWRYKSVTDYVKVSDESLRTLNGSNNVFEQNYMSNGVAGYYSLDFARPVALTSIVIIPVFQSFSSLKTINLVNWEETVISESAREWLNNVSACFCIDNNIRLGGYSEENFIVYNELFANGDYTEALVDGNLALKNVFDGIASSNNDLGGVIKKSEDSLNLLGGIFSKLFSFAIVNDVVIIVVSFAVLGAFVGIGVHLAKKRGHNND